MTGRKFYISFVVVYRWGRWITGRSFWCFSNRFVSPEPGSPEHFAQIHLTFTIKSCHDPLLTCYAGGKGGKGLGKGGAKRHRKILRDNIQGITKPAIRRLARRGGVKRISASKFNRRDFSLIYDADVSFSDIWGDPWCSKDLPWGRHSWCCHLHWARQAQDCHIPWCRLCSQASRPYPLRFRWLAVLHYNYRCCLDYISSALHPHQISTIRQRERCRFRTSTWDVFPRAYRNFW